MNYSFNFTNISKMYNTTEFINPCQQCYQFTIDQQYSAMANVYTKFNTYLLGLIAFFIIYKILEKSISAGKLGHWKIGFGKYSKSFKFNISDDTIKILEWIKNILFGVMFALALVYYFVFGHLAGLGY